MDGYIPLLSALVALLVGLAIGKAWERYKLKDGRWIDRRRARESPHYMLGLNFLVANQIDPAIEELTRAAETAGDPLEIHLILGNLYREKGQVGRAIQEHQALLQRPNLRKLEHANVLLCLGLDYKRGGFVDRALEAFTEVLRLDPETSTRSPTSRSSTKNSTSGARRTPRGRSWQARDTERTGASPRDPGVPRERDRPRGAQARRLCRSARSGFRPRSTWIRATRPAYLNLGDLDVQQQDLPAADCRLGAADRALARPRLSRVLDGWKRRIRMSGRKAGSRTLCRRLIDANPQDWRARLALARHLSSRGSAREALDLLFEALVQNPHALAVHQAIWQTLSHLHLPQSLVERYVELTRDSVFYLDPHVCVRCRYRSTELLWQCPHCHEWNTFVEERIAPAKDNEATLTS